MKNRSPCSGQQSSTHKSSSVLVTIETGTMPVAVVAVSSAGDSVVLHGQGRRRNFLFELEFEEAHPYQLQQCFVMILGLREMGRMLQ